MVTGGKIVQGRNTTFFWTLVTLSVSCTRRVFRELRHCENIPSRGTERVRNSRRGRRQSLRGAGAALFLFVLFPCAELQFLCAFYVS